MAEYQSVCDVVIDALVTDLPEQCVLAFCNYQEVNNSKAINELFNQLLKRLPPHCLIVVESRAVPNFELAPLIVGRKIFGLGSRDLQFSVRDICVLAQVQGLPDFSEEEAVQLATTFQGWITGILLGSRLGSAQFAPFASAQGSTRLNWTNPFNRQQLFAYVVKDIFHAEASIYTFLKNTSLLEQLIPAFCDAFLGTSNAAALLEYAERQGLFVLRIGEAEEPTYACHPVLRQIFQDELRRHEYERYCALHFQIATLSLQNHAFEAALNHAFEAQRDDFAAQILLENASTLLKQGKSEIILSFLDRFPPQSIQTYPRLLLLRVTLFLRRGDFATVRQLLESLEEQIPLAEGIEQNTEEALMSAEFAIASGRLFLSQGAYQQAQYHFRQALSLIPIDERVLRITAHQHLGICLILGDEPIHKGIAQFQQALQLCHPQRDELVAGELHHQLANAYAWIGNYSIAEHHRQRIRTIQDHLDRPQSIINNLTGMGILKMRQGYIEEAETSFQAILQLTQHRPFSSTKTYALLGLGELELIRQRWQEALTHLEEARLLAHQFEDRYLLNGVLYTLSIVYLRIGELQTAQCLLDQTVLRPEETRSYEGISRQLIQATILLARQEYHEARIIFEEIAVLTEQKELLWLRMQALMRLAACGLEQNQPGPTNAALQQVRVLNSKGNFDYGIQIELQVYPKLEPLLREPIEQEQQLDLHIASQKRLKISALGEPVVLVDTLPVTHWRMAHAMEMFFFLLESNQPLRKDQIITALWPETDDLEHVNQTFRSTVYYIRQVMGDASLLQRSGLYRLDLGAIYGEFWYDVAAFQEQGQVAETALKEQDDELAAPALENMIALYKGDYVQAFYSDWCIKRRDELRTAFLEAHRQLALIAWRKEDWNESQLHWQHLLTLDPCLETAHYGMMRCYLRQGKRDLALRQYQRCSRELHEQLHVKPGPALQKLYQHLRDGKA
ncbi:MAG TPA: BTAD domain-containing putative transcriptional regulator [Ktedonobacteraceae bacterium]|nr:BTAD domain-containing putative transcriptional regulator [Ktedonobacteraceae bacterium]